MGAEKEWYDLYIFEEKKARRGAPRCSRGIFRFMEPRWKRVQTEGRILILWSGVFKAVYSGVQIRTANWQVLLR